MFYKRKADNFLANSNIIEADSLVFKYTSDSEELLPEKIPAAVDGISINIKRGSFTALIGRNGSGKSTLAKLLSGVFAPLSGKVLIYPECKDTPLDSVSSEDNFEVRKTVGMVFQNPDNQLVATIVEDDVAFAPENLGIEPLEIRRRVDNALSVVGLSEYAAHDTHKLSGGQKQRVAIAGVLAMSPECIIFDESTAMLDPKGRADIMDTILRLKQSGITVVLITHYMEEAAKADEIFVINDGKLISHGTPTEIFCQKELLNTAGLEPPQAAKLIDSLKASGIDITAESVIDTQSAVLAIEASFEKAGVKKQGPKGAENAGI